MSKLENWFIQTFPSGRQCLWGDIYGDERFEDGKTVRTSELQEINVEEAWAKTLNTKYELGVRNDRYE